MCDGKAGMICGRIGNLMLGMLLLFCFMKGAAAQQYLQCFPIGSLPVDWRVTFTNISDNPNLPVGSEIARGNVTGSPVSIRCDWTRAWNDESPSVLFLYTHSANPGSSQGYEARVYLNNNLVSVGSWYATGNRFSVPGTYTVNAPQGLSIRLIKTGNPMSQYGLGYAAFGHLVMRRADGVGTGHGLTGYVVVNVNAFSPAVRTCTVTTSSVSISLGSVQASTLGSVGSTSPASATQNVSLSCQNSPSVTMTLSGTRADPSLNNVVALTPTSSARGIGVQILRNGNPLAIGTGVAVSPAAGSTLNIPIAARYYRTGDVSVGTANASPTLNFKYN